MVTIPPDTIVPIDGDSPRDSTSEKMRIAVLTEIISPYRIPFLNELSSDPSIDLEAVHVSGLARPHYTAWTQGLDSL